MRALQEYAALFEGMAPALMRRLAAGGALADPPKEGGGLLDVTNAAELEEQARAEGEGDGAEEAEGVAGGTEGGAGQARRSALQQQQQQQQADAASAQNGVNPKALKPIVLGSINLRALLYILTSGKLGGEEDRGMRQVQLQAAIMAGRVGGVGGGGWRT